MKKKLYSEEDETYLNIGHELADEAANVIQPIFDKYVKDGYSIRQVSQILTTVVWECELMGMFNRT
jgi:hypothetical protein